MLVTQARTALVKESKGCSIVCFSILALLLHLSALYGDDNSPSLAQNQNQNSLLEKRQNDNTSLGDWPRKISP